MARYQVTTARLVVLVVGGALLGMLLLDLRFDQWYLTGAAPRRGVEVAYYGHVNGVGSFVPRAVDLSILSVGAAGGLLVWSHSKKEDAGHTHGSTSRASDVVNILVFVVAAPFFVLVVQPALERIVAFAEQGSGEGDDVPAEIRADLATVAQGHWILVGVVLAVLVNSLAYMKRLEGVPPTKVD
jgi:hypothetical protein